MQYAPKPDALTLQADATRIAALTSTASVTMISRAMDGADNLDALQRNRTRKAAAANASAIQVMPVTATAAELFNARKCRSVSKGKDVYLPSWRETMVGLPNAFLRSALFSVSGPLPEAMFEHTIAVQGEISITMTGVKLVDFDRQVFATLLNHYRDRPLPHESDESDFIRLSYWEFAKAMGKKKGADVYKAIHDSLIRLNAAHLRLRVNRRDIPLPSLVRVIFNYQTPTPKGSTTRLKADIEFRVSAEMAELYGPSDWTSVSLEMLDEYTGLIRWLNTFYSTHAGPHTMSIKKLYKISGSICTMSEFRGRLKVALTRLQATETTEKISVLASDSIRVRNFILDSKKDELTVNLVRWEESATKAT